MTFVSPCKVQHQLIQVDPRKKGRLPNALLTFGHERAALHVNEVILRLMTLSLTND